MHSERAGSTRWRAKVSHAMRVWERAAWWARLNGWTLNISELKADGHFCVSLHRFRDGGADMLTCPWSFTTLAEAQRAAESYAITGAWS